MGFSQIALLSLAESFVAVHYTDYFQLLGANTVARYALAITSLIAFQGIAYIFYHWLIYPKFTSPLLGIPEPKAPSFWNGNGKQIIAEKTGEPQRAWINELPNDGLIRYLGIMNRERLMPTSPKVLAEVLTSKSYTYIKPRLFQVNLARILGNGLLMAEGDEHKRQRKILTPAFHPRHLRSLFPLFMGKARQMTELIMQQVEKSATEEVPDPIIDWNSWGSRCTLDIIGKAGAGIDFNAMTDSESDLLKVYQKVFAPTPAQQGFGIITMFLPVWMAKNLPMKAMREFSAARRVIAKICLDIIKKKKQEMHEKKEMNQDILSIMIEEGSLSDEEMQNQLMTFMAAGHETTAASVSWSVYMLARHPDVAEKLRTAIRDAIPSWKDGFPSMETIENIKYLKNFCNEIMRFHPPVPLTLRESATDATLNGHFIPKHTTIMIVAAAINHSTEFWGPDASEFNPDRWDRPGGNGGATSNYGNMTFLMGPRSCIGQKFAMEEYKAIMCCLAGMFAFEEKTKDMEITVRGGITQRPIHDGMLPLKTRVVPGW